MRMVLVEVGPVRFELGTAGAVGLAVSWRDRALLVGPFLVSLRLRR